MSSIHSFLGDLKECTCLEHIIECLIDGKQNLFFGRERVLILRLFAQARACHQIGGVTKIRDELASLAVVLV